MVENTGNEVTSNQAKSILSPAWAVLIRTILDRYDRSFMNQLGVTVRY